MRTAPDAPSGPNVLAQEDDDRADYRFPIAVEDSVSFQDVNLSVRCKPVEGKVDRACAHVGDLGPIIASRALRNTCLRPWSGGADDRGAGDLLEGIP